MLLPLVEAMTTKDLSFHRFASEASGTWHATRSRTFRFGQHQSSQAVPWWPAVEEKDENLVPPLSLLCVGDISHVSNMSSRASSSSLALQLAATTGGRQLPPSHRKYWFAFTLSFAFVVKTACMLSNIIFSMSPIPQVRQFSKAGDTGPIDAAPFVSILYGGGQWCFYGLFAYLVTKKSGFLVLVYSNVLGAVLGVYYVWGFRINCRDKFAQHRLKKYGQAAAMSVSLQVLAILVLSRRRALLLCGLASSVCSVVGSCSLLATLPVVLVTKCSASINVPLTVVGFFSGWLWLTCGFILWDAWIILPQIGCLALNMFTMSMLVYFPRDPAEAATKPDLCWHGGSRFACFAPEPEDEVSCCPDDLDSSALMGASGAEAMGGATSAQQETCTAQQSSVRYGSILSMLRNLRQTFSNNSARSATLQRWTSFGETGGTM